MIRCGRAGGRIFAGAEPCGLDCATKPLGGTRTSCGGRGGGEAARRGCGRAGPGFSLVNLVVVVAILAVLTSVALPRLLELGSAAHDEAVAGTSEAFERATNMANLACSLRNWGGRDNLPNFGEGNVDFNSNCFPTDTRNRNRIGGNNRRCQRIWNGLLEPAPPVQMGGSGDAAYRAFGAGGSCRFVYLLDDAMGREIVYDATTGEVRALVE